MAAGMQAVTPYPMHTLGQELGQYLARDKAAVLIAGQEDVRRPILLGHGRAVDRRLRAESLHLLLGEALHNQRRPARTHANSSLATSFHASCQFPIGGWAG